jgi:protein TonB
MSRRSKKSTKVYAISIGVHLVIGLAIAFIPKDKLKEIIAISMGESNKPKPQPPKREDKPRESKPRVASRGPARGAVSPVNAAPAAAAAHVFTDIGISMDASGSEGVAVATAPKAPPPPKLIAVEPAKPKVLAAKAPDCTEPLVKAKPERVVRPEFTTEARSAGIDGRVVVEVQIDDRGDVVSARVVKGLGHGLDETSLDAAKRTHFHPATRCGKPVPGPFLLAMRFSLST